MSSASDNDVQRMVRFLSQWVVGRYTLRWIPCALACPELGMGQSPPKTRSGLAAAVTRALASAKRNLARPDIIR